MKSLELKKKMSRFNSRMKGTEERINKFRNKATENIQYEYKDKPDRRKRTKLQSSLRL